MNQTDSAIAVYDPQAMTTASPATFVNRYRCPPRFAEFGVAGELSAEAGFFKFGDAVGYGRCHGAPPAASPSDIIPDVSDMVACLGGRVRLPLNRPR